MSEVRLIPAPPPADAAAREAQPSAGTSPAADTSRTHQIPAGASESSGGAAASAGPASHPAAQQSDAPVVPARAPKLFAFASGKGGVGKSLLVANLGIQLARQGRSAILVDFDLASATLHSYLGAGTPQSSVDDLLTGRNVSLASLVRDTSTPGLRLIAGSRSGWRSQPRGDELERIVVRAHDLAADCVLIDLPSGRQSLTVDVLALADCGVLVTTPEPGSIESCYRLVEELAVRCLLHPESEERRAAEAVLGAEAMGRGPAGFLDSLADVDSACASRLGERLRQLRLAFVINQSRSEGETQAGLTLRFLCRHYLGVDIEFGGVVEFDLSAWQASRQRKSLSQKYPNAPATRTIEQIASTLLSRPAPPRSVEARWVTLGERSLYEMLELPPSASQRDLQRAYDRLQAVTGPEGDLLGGAVHAERARAVRARIETAYRTLVFMESRSEYDRSLVSAGRVRPEQLRDPSLVAAGARTSPAPPAAGNISGRRCEAPATRPDGGVAADPAAAAGAAPARPALQRPSAPRAPLVPRTRFARVKAAALAPSPPPKPSEPTPAPEIGPVSGAGAPLVYSGPVLAALRRERGLSLEAIGAVSKVRTSHLRSVEEERFSELPAPIFLKGFVREYARCLSLDPVKVWQDYLGRYEEWKRSRSQG